MDRAQGYRWRRAAGGRVPAAPREVSGRFLSLQERLRIADLHLAGHGVRGIAAALGRAPSTISRELSRGGAPSAGPGRPRPTARASRAYAPYAAHQRAAARARRPKVAKLDDPLVGAELSAT
ncbi:helix-turn-helix domain-containing protein [Aquipuribacter hungaricus]|uniref:helix-turn-helix domain-containing protein n=1 Tax=Aquipuribacter hungaricus TaxID=545624 RepID=UPI003BEF2E6E